MQKGNSFYKTGEQAEVKLNLTIKIGNMEFKNPVMNSSGTFDFFEYMDFFNVNEMGAFIPKSITLKERKGNPPPRLVEVAGGIINSIGIQNEGVEKFINFWEDKKDFIKTNFIVSIAGTSYDEYEEIVKRLETKNFFSGYEVNISCPNIEKGGKTFGQCPEDTYEVIKRVKDKTQKTVIAKLSPFVTDITEIAKKAKEAGADAITVANTIPAMLVNLNSKKPYLGNKTGGLSGPAIKPIIMKLIYDINNKKINIPVIACGGIMNAKDALEYLALGAFAVQIGTANFINPKVIKEVIEGIKEYMLHEKIYDIMEFIGILER